MSKDSPPSLREILEHQSGALTRGQALSAGLTDSAIKSSLRSGRWQRLQTAVYTPFTGPPPRSTVLWAAVLRAGPGSALSHQTAAELHGFLEPVTPIHVTVPSGSQVARPEGVILHYSRRLEQARHPALSPPRTRFEDTVLDLAESAANSDQAVSLMLKAIASRRTTAQHLAAAMEQRPRLRRRQELAQAAGLGGDGAHSLLEFRYVFRVEQAHGLPTGRRQHPVIRDGRRQYQDVEYEGHLVVVELDGQESHPLWTRWDDVRRDNASVAAGQITLRYGWIDVNERACRVAAQVGHTLAGRRWTGRLRRCGPRCEIGR